VSSGFLSGEEFPAEKFAPAWFYTKKLSAGLDLVRLFLLSLGLTTYWLTPSQSIEIGNNIYVLTF
jgi:hypothetical protein